MKENIYHTSCFKLTKLKRRMASAICSITIDTPQNAWKNAQDRANAIVRKNEGHLEPL